MHILFYNAHTDCLVMLTGSAAATALTDDGERVRRRDEVVRVGRQQG